jgi:DNA-binding MarR family transcriptional regulator
MSDQRTTAGAAAHREAVPVSHRLLPRQAARCLRWIAAHPGSSSAQVQAGVGIRHPSQLSTVLLRLERDGLVGTERGRRALNAWRVTDQGRAVLEQMPEGLYD